MMRVSIENVGDGTLVAFSDGSSIWFDSRANAAEFGRNLMMVAALGGDTLDGAPALGMTGGDCP